MKLIICLITLNAFSVLYAKDCHDCSVNKAPPTEAPLLSRLEEITKKVETIKEAKTRNSLCSDASSGKGNWKRFQQTFTDNKIEIEKYYVENKCGNNENFTFMHYAINSAGNFGVDFVAAFLKYLEQRQVETGDDKIIYRLLNLTFNPERKTTLLDELKISGYGPDLNGIKLIAKYGAKPYEELTKGEIANGYYAKKDEVAAK